MEAKHLGATYAVEISQGGFVGMRETIQLDRPADSIEAVFRINVTKAFAHADDGSASAGVDLTLAAGCDECTVRQEIRLVDSYPGTFGEVPEEIDDELLEYKLRLSFDSGLPIPPGELRLSAWFHVYASSGFLNPLDQPHALLNATLESMTLTIDRAG
jgi:hypothetical protein